MRVIWTSSLDPIKDQCQLPLKQNEARGCNSLEQGWPYQSVLRKVGRQCLDPLITERAVAG